MSDQKNALSNSNSLLDAGDTFSEALDITLEDTPSIFSDWVGENDPYDYYRFSLDETSNLSLSLTGLSEWADVELLDNSGAVLVRADGHKTIDQNINNFRLFEGTYYIRVYPHNSSNNTNYDLSVSATPVLNPENPPSTPNTLYVEELRRMRDYGFAITGPSPNDGFGRSITTGDVNEDGFTDLIIGADNINSVDPDGDPTVIVNFIEMKWKLESAYVIYGEEGGFLNPVDLTSPDGRESSVLKGQVEGLFYTDEAGTATDAGDFNGDGIKDVIVGAPEANTAYHRNAGEAFVLLGSEEKFPAEVELSELNSELVSQFLVMSQ